jgi:hypothetical protein
LFVGGVGTVLLLVLPDYAGAWRRVALGWANDIPLTAVSPWGWPAAPTWDD